METIDLTEMSSDQAEEEEEEEEESAEPEAPETPPRSTPSYARKWTPQDPGSETARAQRSSSIESTITDKMEARTRPQVVISDENILSRAIVDVPAAHVQKALLEICRKIPAARKLALEKLTIYEDQLLTEDHYEENPDDSDEDNDKALENFEFGEEECDWRHNKAQTDPWWKQRCARYDVCERCGENFELEHNNINSCQWHPGEKEINMDASIWQSGEFDCDDWGLFESFSDDPHYESGFQWSCCCGSYALYGECCEKGRHERTKKAPSAPAEPKKRASEEVKHSRNVKQRRI